MLLVMQVIKADESDEKDYEYIQLFTLAHNRELPFILGCVFIPLIETAYDRVLQGAFCIEYILTMRRQIGMYFRTGAYGIHAIFGYHSRILSI